MQCTSQTPPTETPIPETRTDKEQLRDHAVCIHLADIRLDGGTQLRVELDQKAIADYADRLKDEKAPPIILMYDGCDYWLVDGFHRYHAAKKAGYLDILADVRSGTLLDAIELALTSNLVDSIQRKPGDKRRYVETALEKCRNGATE